MDQNLSWDVCKGFSANYWAMLYVEINYLFNFRGIYMYNFLREVFFLDFWLIFCLSQLK